MQSDLPQCDVGRPVEDGGRRSDPPFCPMFPWAPEDEMGATQIIQQGEGGEQGDPLMPMLFALGQHLVLAILQQELQSRAHLGKTQVWNRGGVALSS